jgi:2-haloacid dehalogenase
MPSDALVFDAYGTLFDVHSVVATTESIWPGNGTQLSQLWRSRQLEYTWLRSLMGRYEDFSQVTVQALRFACRSLALPLDATAEAKVLDAYRRLAVFPDVRDALARLVGRTLAILSNGAPEMLHAVVRNAGLDAQIPHVLSVDAVRVFKPDRRVYQLAVDALGVPRERIGFVSANCWDAVGAKAFGLRVFWVNRSTAPAEELGVVPDHVIGSLAELPALVG